MTYATLVFGRVRVDVVEVSDKGNQRELDKKRAEEYYERAFKVQWETYEQEYGALRDKAQQFISSAKVRTYEEMFRQWSEGPRRLGFSKGPEPELLDEVTVASEVYRVPRGTAQEFVRAEAERRFPHPTAVPKPPEFGEWFTRNKKEKRTWHAEFLTGGGTQAVDLDDDLDWSWGFPIHAALRELDRLEREGWALVYASEDHGLYKGADAADEAYPTRIRYLLCQR